jgi:hypothetical protein
VRSDLVLDREPASESLEALRAPDAYARAPACNWGYAPGFMRTDWLDRGPPAEQRPPVLARRVALSGWAADARTLQPAREVMVYAQGRLIGRTVPTLKRPDVARALGSAALERSGFSISQEWIDQRPFAWGGLRVYATSGDGKASPLETSWHGRGDGPSDLLDGKTSTPVIAGSTRGWVDRAEVEEAERITPFELPAGIQVSTASGLELDLEVSRNALVIISDQPFASPEASGAQSQPAPAAISFRVPAPRSGTIRVMLENCPQWYALRGRILYLRYGDAVTVRGVRVLLRPG